METKKLSVFDTLNSINVGSKTKEKNKLTYLPWAAAWQEVKKLYPNSTYEVFEMVIDEYGNTRPWFTDSVSGWVKVSVTIEGLTHTETLPIMDYKNQPIKADEITATQANKAIKRCFVKCLALHGVGLYLYLGDDLPENESQIADLQKEIAELVNKRVALSDSAKNKVAELCKAAEKEANPEIEDDLIRGNYKNIDDIEILKKLKVQLMAVRK